MEKILILGKIEGGNRRGQQRMTEMMDGITELDMSLNKRQELVTDRKTWRGAVHGASKSQTGLTD